MTGGRGLPLRTRLVVAALERAGRTPIEEASLEDIREARARVYPTRAPFSCITGPLGDAEVGTSGVPARDGHDVPVRWYRPRRATGDLPLLVYVHGGGWVWGSTAMYDPLCSRLAAGAGAVVVSVDYRMAPEHRAPQAVHDVVDVVRWLVEHAGTQGADGRGLPTYDADRVGVGGDSAGGHLSAVAAQELRDLPGPGGAPALRHQALIYPATDMTLASPSIEEHAEGAVLTKAGIIAFRGHYLGPGFDEAVLRDPVSSPLFGDVAGVAPALVQTADLDPIRDDGLRYAAHLEAAGVPVRVTNYVGMAHGYASMPGVSLSGAQAESELVGEVRRHLRPAEVGEAGSGA